VWSPRRQRSARCGRCASPLLAPPTPQTDPACGTSGYLQGTDSRSTTPFQHAPSHQLTQGWPHGSLHSSTNFHAVAHLPIRIVPCEHLQTQCKSWAAVKAACAPSDQLPTQLRGFGLSQLLRLMMHGWVDHQPPGSTAPQPRMAASTHGPHLSSWISRSLMCSHSAKVSMMALLIGWEGRHWVACGRRPVALG